MEFLLTYTLNGKDGRQIERQEAKAQIEDMRLCLHPSSNDALLIGFRDIASVSKAGYRVQIDLYSGQNILLSDLGYHFDGFFKALRMARNELIIKDMLMHEPLKEKDIEAEFSLWQNGVAKVQKETCEIRLYETGMVLIPLENEIVRIPYSDIEEVVEQDYSIRIKTEFDETFAFFKLARKLDFFKQTLAGLRNDLSEKTQAMLREMVPAAPSLSIRQAASLMKEGRAAKKSDIESVLPELYSDLEKKLEIAGIRQEYAFLSKKAWQQKICIGIKRGLMGDLTGDIIWFLIPICAKGTDAGNAIAIEAASIEKKTSNATYFFRITGRAEYGELAANPSFGSMVDDFIKRFNRAMIAINFRREPIYLPFERLGDPRFEKYKFSIARMPELRILRKHFIGRVFHRDHQKWCSDVEDLLQFHMRSTDDEAKWKYTETDTEEG